MIYRIPKDAENYGSYTTLDNLKNKIIIKGKAKVVTLLNLLYGADRDQRKTLGKVSKGKTMREDDKK